MMQDVKKRKVYHAEWYEKNKEHLQVQHAEYYRKNKEHIAIQEAEYREKNKERIAARNAKYRQANRTHILAKQAAWREKNKEHLAVYFSEYHRKNKDRIAAYREANKEHKKAYSAAYWKQNKAQCSAHNVQYRQTIRNQFYDMYGLPMEGHEHGVCTCCKEADLVLLGTLSHIDGSGNHHKMATNGSLIKMLREAITVYNPQRFAAECYNCNLAAERWGREAIVTIAGGLLGGQNILPEVHE